MNYKRIREARKTAKITQEELAQILGVNRATISKYETGVIDIPTSQIETIADALGVPVYEFYGGAAEGEFIRFERDVDPNILKSLPGYIPGEHGQFSVEPGSEAEKMLREIIVGSADPGKLKADKKPDTTPPDKVRLMTAYDCLNPSGQQEAVKRVEELTEIPRYQRQEPQDGPGAPSKGKDTPDAQSPSETPAEGKK